MKCAVAYKAAIGGLKPRPRPCPPHSPSVGLGSLPPGDAGDAVAISSPSTATGRCAPRWAIPNTRPTASPVDAGQLRLSGKADKLSYLPSVRQRTVNCGGTDPV